MWPRGVDPVDSQGRLELGGDPGRPVVGGQRARGHLPYVAQRGFPRGPADQQAAEQGVVGSGDVRRPSRGLKLSGRGRLVVAGCCYAGR